MTYRFLALSLVWVFATPFLASYCSGQTDEPVAAAKDEVAQRLEQMEKRIAHLERLLFSTAQLSAYEAERRLDVANERLKQSRRLFLRGALDSNQMEHDRFVARRAERELDLARARDGQYRISAEIDLLQAQYNLDVARRQLEFSRGLLTRGYVTDDQIAREQTNVERAQTALEASTEKLDAIRQAELKGLEEKSPEEKPKSEPPGSGKGPVDEKAGSSDASKEKDSKKGS